MGNYDMFKAMIAAFSGKENIIGVPRAYCGFMRSLEGGVFLSQLIYYSDKGGNRDGWFYKTYDEWESETFLSEYKVRKYARQLEDMGVLETKVMRAEGSPTVHYRFYPEKFRIPFLNFLGFHTKEISDSLTETTTETTTSSDEAERQEETDPPADDFSDWEADWEENPPERTHVPEGMDPAEYYRGRAAEALQRGMARAEGSPWIHWHVNNRSMASRDGISKLNLQRVGWMIQERTGLAPTSRGMKGWVSALAQVYEAADGDFDVIQAGIDAVMKRDKKYRPGHAAGFVDEVRKAAAERRLAEENAADLALGKYRGINMIGE